MSPEDDLGLIDREAVIIGRGQTWRRTDRAVDIEHHAAAAADQVMMIVSYAILVAGRGSRGLNPADEVLLHQDAQRIVDRLARNRPENRADIVHHFVRRGVGMRRHRPQNGQPLGGDLQTVLAQKSSNIVMHEDMRSQILD